MGAKSARAEAPPRPQALIRRGVRPRREAAHLGTLYAVAARNPGEVLAAEQAQVSGLEASPGAAGAHSAQLATFGVIVRSAPPAQ